MTGRLASWWTWTRELGEAGHLYKQGNDFNGEPCDPVEADFIFIPRRDTW